MKTSERIAELLKQRETKVTALATLADTSETEGRAMNEDELRAFDECDTEIKSIDSNVERLRKLEATLARGAEQVNGPRIQVIERPKPEKGIRFARYVQAIAFTKGNMMQAMEIAKQQWQDTPEVADILRAQAFGVTRAAIAAGTTVDPIWAAPLAAASQVSGELIELVRAEAMLGRLTGVRRVPFNVRIPRETVALGTAGWVGQGNSKPVGKAGYDLVTIPPTKAALIVVITEELARFSNPSAEGQMRTALVRAIADFLDDQFVDSALAPVANVSPGGITNGLTGAQTFPSSGDTLAHMQYDIGLAVATINAVSAPRSPAWLMHPQKAIAVGQIQNGLGQPAFPTMANGVLAGYPVFTSPKMALTEVALIDQDAVLMASDDGVTVDVSSEASIQMDSAPATPPTPLVSFWQQNLIGLRAEQFIYWMRARDTSFVLITAVDWGSVAPVAVGGTRAGTAGQPGTQPAGGTARVAQQKSA